MLLKNLFSFAKSCMSAITSLCRKEDLEAIFDNESVKEICRKVAELRGKKAETEEEKRENKEAADRLKKTLPVLMPHAYFGEGGRRCKENAQESPWVSMDYDNIVNPREVWETIKEKVLQLHCPLAFISPSGMGLKFITALPSGMNREQAQAWMAGILEMPDYDHTHDLARCCFLVGRDNLLHYDPELLFSAEVEIAGEPGKRKEVIKAETSNEEDSSKEEETSEEPEPCYLGIPYKHIIKKFWDLFNGGETPVKSNRNALTFDLAYHLRSITGYNRELLCKIIPCYDGFSEEEKQNCIDSALKRQVGGISEKMRKVLEELKKENAFKPEIVQAIEEVEEVDDNYDLNQIKAAFAQKGARKRGITRHKKGELPAGLRETLENIPGNMVMPVIIGAAVMMGVVASLVRLVMEYKSRSLNLIGYIVGESGARKSLFDDLRDQWMKPWLEEQKVEEAKDEEYEELKRQKKNAKEQPKDPHAQLLMLSPRTSTSKAMKRLKNAKDRMCFTYAQEMDMKSASGGQSFNKELGVIARCAYDNSSYSTDFQNVETGRINVEAVRWNTLVCGTPDALDRLIRNYTDGELTRAAIAAMPDNTFAKKGDIKPRSEETQKRMEHIARLMMNMKGEVILELLENNGSAWQEEVRLQAMRADDKVMARQRFRIPTTATRIVCCFMMCEFADFLIESLDNCKGDLPDWAHGCTTAEQYLNQHPDAVGKWLPNFQSSGWIELHTRICNYLLNSVLAYFRERIEAAYDKRSYVNPGQITSKTRTTKNSNIYEKLGQTFSVDEAYAVRGDNNRNATCLMLRNWKAQGLVTSTKKGFYEKVA